MNAISIDRVGYSFLLQGLYRQVYPFHKQFDCVVGIERGGAMVGRWLAYALHKDYQSVVVQRYGDDMTPVDTEPTIDLLRWPKPHAKPLLLVDDVIDTGRTIEIIEEITKETNKTAFGQSQTKDFYLACLFWCAESCSVTPDIFVEQKKGTDWIVFPWELII